MFKNVLLALLITALIGGVATALVRSQSQTAEVDVRVRAKRLADGRTEFEIQQRESGAWSESLFRSNPRLRADPVIDRWYSSGAVTATTEVPSMPGDSVSSKLGTSTVPTPPRNWRPLGATDGEENVRVEYSVEEDPFDQELTTIITSRRFDDNFGYVEVHQVCRNGAFDIVLDSDDIWWGFGDPPKIRYRFDDGPVQELTTTRYSDSPYGWSPAHDPPFRLNLEQAQSITIQFEGDSGTTAGTIDLAGFFSTAVQGNIDYCGQDPPAEWSPHGDTAGEVQLYVQYSVTRSIESATLSTVISVGEYAEGEIHLICDRGRFDLIVESSRYHSTSSGVPEIYVRLDGGEVESFRWPMVSTWESGFSPDNDRAFMDRLKQSNTATIHVGGVGGGSGETVRLAGLFDTRAQGNIEYCGQY